MTQSNKLLENVILIAKHGELRDVEFIENLFSTKFISDPQNYIFFPVMGVNALSAISLTPSKLLFNKSKFIYVIYTAQPKSQSTRHIAKISIERIDMSFCIKRSEIDSMLKEINPHVFYMTPPPLLPPIMNRKTKYGPSFGIQSQVTYSYTVKQTDEYVTNLNFIQIEGSACATSISIEQDFLT